MSSLNLSCRADITPNFSDLPEVKRPRVLEPRTRSQTSALPSLLADEEDLVTPLCVMILKLTGVGRGHGPVLKEVWMKAAPFQFFSSSNYTCCYLWFSVSRPKYHFPAIQPDASFPKACQMSHGTLHLAEIWLPESPGTNGELSHRERPGSDVLTWLSCNGM